MKAVVVIKSARGRAYNLLRHCYLPEGRQGAEVPSISDDNDRVYGLLNGLNVGGISRAASVDAHSLVDDLPAGRAEIRHIVLSIEDTADPAQREKSLLALADMGEQFAKTFAPTSQYIGVLHQDRLHPHLHLIFQNSTRENEAALTWNRDDLMEMQSMDWVSDETKQQFSIESGRSQGLTKREGTNMPYPLAINLDAMSLATATENQLSAYENTDIITTGRATTERINSINFNGREIRTSTVRFLASYSSIQAPASQLPANPTPRRNRRLVSKRPSPAPEIN